MDFAAEAGEWLSATLKLFALMTPPAVLSAFVSGTRDYDPARKKATALRTGSAVLIIGLVLYFFGNSLFSLFGFTLDAFRIGAGSLLFLTAISLMHEKIESHPADNPEDDISVVPLAIPLCMGPASIGTVMVMGASAASLHERLIGAAALVTASLGITVMLLAADRLKRILRRTGLAVLAKLTGLLLAAIAAQVIFTGAAGFMR